MSRKHLFHIYNKQQLLCTSGNFHVIRSCQRKDMKRGVQFGSRHYFLTFMLRKIFLSNVKRRALSPPHLSFLSLLLRKISRHSAQINSVASRCLRSRQHMCQRHMRCHYSSRVFARARITAGAWHVTAQRQSTRNSFHVGVQHESTAFCPLFQRNFLTYISAHNMSHNEFAD